MAISNSSEQSLPNLPLVDISLMPSMTYDNGEDGMKTGASSPYLTHCPSSQNVLYALQGLSQLPIQPSIIPVSQDSSCDISGKKTKNHSKKSFLGRKRSHLLLYSNQTLTSSGRKKFRSIKPAVANVGTKNNELTPHVKPFDCISIENCKLNTEDSRCDNVVIVLKDEENSLFDSFNTNSVRTINSDDIVPPSNNDHSCALDEPGSINFSDYVPDDMRISSKYFNSFDCKIDGPLEPKNIDNYFIIDEDCFPRGGSPLLGGEDFHLKCDSNSEGIPFPSFLCILCKASETICLQKYASSVVGSKKVKAVDILSRILNLSAAIIYEAGEKICVKCLNLLEEIEVMKRKLELKENIIREMFASETVGEIKMQKDSIEVKRDDAELFPSKKNNHELFDNNIKEDDFEFAVEPKRRQYRCLKCHTSFQCSDERKAHMRKCKLDSVGQEEYEFTSKSAEGNNKRKRRGKYSCDQCSKIFLTYQSLKSHKVSHQEHSHDCSICGRYLTSKARLEAHMFKFHGVGEGKSKKFECDKCEKKFETRAGLQYHKNVTHQSGTKYICDHCQKVYYDVGPYKSHLLFAHGRKKIVCETCGSMFFTVSKLNAHINSVHRLAQTWQCVECDVKFSNGASFRRHKAIKHAKAKYPCEYCPARFTSKASFQSHLREHSIFICKLCGSTFNKEQLFNSHMLGVHKQVVPKLGKRRSSSSSGLHTSKKSKVKDINKAAPKSKKASVDNPLRMNLNDILLSNSFTDGSGTFNSNISLPDNGGKIRAFTLLGSGGNLEMASTSSNNLPISSDMSFINVEILDNIEISSSDNNLNAAEVTDLPPPLTTNDNLDQAVSELEPSVNDLEPSVNDLEPSVNDLEPSVNDLEPSVDIDVASVSELNESVNDIEPSVHQLDATDKTLVDPSTIWIKENDWAILKSGSNVENLNALQTLAPTAIEDLDIGVIDGSIVDANVIDDTDASIHLGISVADKNAEDLSDLNIDS